MIMGIDLVTATKLVGPAMGKTFLASLRKKKGNEEKPTDDPGYRETLELMRKLLYFCALSKVEDLHQITNLHTPPPPSCLVTEVEIPDSFNSKAATFIQRQLGPNLDKVGRTWWQWRKLGSVVRAEWVEMKNDYLERKAKGDPGQKVMFYVHGGAYYLGGIGHDIQVQRHARKLKGRCFAPRYRLAPEFPFPCAIQDILSAYMYLLTIVDSTNIVIAGDSAGGGLCLALLLICRDQRLPMPAGASLISPWVDLTHSFPSITIPSEFDYLPAYGFHAKPSLSWPPPTRDEMRVLGLQMNPALGPDYEIEIDGQQTVIEDQVLMYAPNLQGQIPLVSGVLAASLGGFCPTQVIVGGGEILRDEQLYLAHKMADPPSYPPCEEILKANGETLEDVAKYPPTDVQLLVFNDGPHAAPMLGHVNIAKHEYRSIAQFAAWALSKAQQAAIEIEDFETHSDDNNNAAESADVADAASKTIGKAGDPLPPFVNHMIRLRVDLNGNLWPLEPASQLRGCRFPNTEIGFPKGEALKGYKAFKTKWDVKFATEKKKVFDKRKENAKKGYITFPNGEIPPPTALAGRRIVGEVPEIEKPSANLANSVIAKMFRKFGHDEPVVENAKQMSDFEKTDRRRSRMVMATEIGT